MDVFVDDRATGETYRVSASSSGAQAEEDHQLQPGNFGKWTVRGLRFARHDLESGDTNVRTDVSSTTVRQARLPG